MNEELIKYLNELSAEKSKKILDSISRDSNPSAKSFWKRVHDAKKTKTWNNELVDSLSSFVLSEGAEPIENIFSSAEIPESIKSISSRRRKGAVDYFNDYPDKKRNPSVVNFQDDFLDKASREFGSSYGTDPSVTPVGSTIDVESQRKDVVDEYAKVNPKVPDKPIKRTPLPVRAEQKPISAPKRDDPNAKAFEEFRAGLSEELSSWGNQKLTDSVKSWEAQTSVDSSNSNLQKQERVNNFLNTFKDTLGPLYDTFQYIEQRKTEKDAMRVADQAQLNAPAVPGIRGENRVLSNLIRNSQVANMNPGQMIQPYMDQTNLGYNQDLQMAQELSGGQAGAMSGLSQGAAIRRNQANSQGAGMMSDIYRQGIATTGALVGQQMQDDTWRDQQAIDIWKARSDTNQTLQQQAGMGLAMSRARTLQARNNMYDSLLESPVFDVETYMNMTRGNLTAPTI